MFWTCTRWLSPKQAKVTGKAVERRVIPDIAQPSVQRSRALASYWEHWLFPKRYDPRPVKRFIP